MVSKKPRRGDFVAQIRIGREAVRRAGRSFQPQKQAEARHLGLGATITGMHAFNLGARWQTRRLFASAIRLTLRQDSGGGPPD